MITTKNCTARTEEYINAGIAPMSAAFKIVWDYCRENGINYDHISPGNTAIQEVIIFIQQLIDFKNETLAKELKL